MPRHRVKRPIGDLGLATVEADGIRFETSKSVTFPYYRRPSGGGQQFYAGERFAQHIEPSGQYMSFHGAHDNVDVPGLEMGQATFKSPLVLYWDGYDESGWKARLSRHFGGKKHKALSAAIRKAGYDGIVTVHREWNEPSEIVKL